MLMWVSASGLALVSDSALESAWEPVWASVSALPKGSDLVLESDSA
jgi:hypothetical protein